jgi:SMODS-associated NUDIX domain
LIGSTAGEREISHWREFYEELIDGKGKILSKEKFPYVNYNLVSSVRTPLKKAKMWDCWEILHYDVLDLLPNENQQKELEALFEDGDTDYIKWADYELIQCLGYNKHTRETPYGIGEHTKWVVNLEWNKD